MQTWAVMGQCSFLSFFSVVVFDRGYCYPASWSRLYTVVVLPLACQAASGWPSCCTRWFDEGGGDEECTVSHPLRDLDRDANWMARSVSSHTRSEINNIRGQERGKWCMRSRSISPTVGRVQPTRDQAAMGQGGFSPSTKLPKAGRSLDRVPFVSWFVQVQMSPHYDGA